MSTALFANRGGVFVFALAASIAVAAGSAGAQTQPSQMIHGRLVEDQLKTPVEGASVTLLSTSGRELDRVVTTNKNGIFVLPVEPGSYRLRIRRLAFAPVETEILRVEKEMNIEVNFTMTPVSIKLAKINVVSRPGVERGRNGLYERKALGKGLFLVPADFADIAHEHPTTILGRVAGLRQTPDLGIESLEGHRCLQFLVNRLPVKMVPEAKMGLDEQFPTLFELVPNGLEIAGIEIYREFSEVPPVFRFDAWPGSRYGRGVTPPPTVSRKMAERDPPPCGLINIWTRGAW